MAGINGVVAEELIDHYMLLNKSKNAHYHDRPYLHGLVPKVSRSQTKNSDGGKKLSQSGSIVWHLRKMKLLSRNNSGMKTPVEKYLAGKHRGSVRTSVKKYPDSYLAKHIEEGREWEMKLAVKYESIFIHLRRRLFYLRRYRAEIIKIDTALNDFKKSAVNAIRDVEDTLLDTIELAVEQNNIEGLEDLRALVEANAD